MRKVWRIPLPGNQIPDPIKVFIVFPIPASYFSQIPDPENSQLYLAFSPSVPGDDEIALNSLCHCIKDLKRWMIRDQLKLND